MIQQQIDAFKQRSTVLENKLNNSMMTCSNVGACQGRIMDTKHISTKCATCG